MNSTFKRNALKFFIFAFIAVMIVCAFSSCGDETCKHEYEDTVVPPTCTSEGYTVHKCKNCTDEYIDTKVAKTEHNYTEASITVATCQTEGERTLKCSACGDEKKETLAKNPNEHRYVHVTVTHPTCTEKGYTTHTCDCGASYTDSEVAAKNHSFVDTVIAPTCTQQGYTTHKCQNCPESYVDTYVAMLPHSYTPVVTAPTCKEQGYTTYTCSCKKSYVDNYTAIREHDWDDGEITTNPACLVEGVKTFTCKYDDCNEHKTESVPALSHIFEDTVIAPTCEEKGYTLHTCKNGCKTSYKDTYTDSTGHSWPVALFSLTPTEGIEITKPASCEEEGIVTYTCQNDNCGKTKQEITPPTGHNTEGNSATVVRVLKAGESCIYIATYTTACHNEGCDGFIEVKEEEIHNYYWKITTEATCTTPGEKTYVCSLCGSAHPDKDPESFENPDAHNWVAGETINGVTPYSCECGATKGSVVSEETSAKVDKDVFESADSIELSGAELDFADGISDKLNEGEEVSIKVETVEGDIKNAAVDKIQDATLKEKISNSDVYSFELKTGENQISDLGGDAVIKIKYELDEGEDPENIYIYYINSSGEIVDCKAEYSNGYAVFTTDHFSYYTVVRFTAEEMCAKLGYHDFVSTEYQPTCVRDGYTINTCARCGFVERIDGEAAYGHKHSSEVTEPTCYTDGFTTYTCDNGCGHTYVSDYVDKTGHIYDDGTDVPASCKTKGYTVYRCTNDGCEAEYTENFTDFADHSWNAGSFTKTPSCTEGGTRVYKCDVCKAERSEYVAAFGHKYSNTTVAPTCEEQGYVLHKCSNCDASYKDTYTATVPHNYKNGVCQSCDKVCEHTFGAYTYNNDGKCTTDGTETASCTECDVKNTRTKAGTATGHSYVNSVCSKCGDGCNHNFGAYTSNGDATCEHDGTKTRTCSSCQAKETVTDEGTKLTHSFHNGICSNCFEPCEHEYEDGVCKHCEESENNFYATFLSSILTSNSFYLEIEDSEFIMNALEDAELEFNAGEISSAKLSIEFEDGKAIIKILAEGSYTSCGIETSFKIYGVTKGGLLIMKIEETLPGNVTKATYQATNVDLSGLDGVFGAIDSDISQVPSEPSASYVKNLLMTRFPNTIGNLFGNVLEAAFKKTATEDGFVLTFDADNLHELNDLLLNGTLADAIDVILGDGAYDDLRNYIINSLDKDVKVVVTELCNYFIENDKISKDEMDELILLMTDGESISSIPDMTLKEFLVMAMDMPSSILAKELIKYVTDRFTELSTYDLISFAMSMSSMEVNPEDLHALVGEYIDLYADFGQIKIYTDKNGKLISIDADVAFDMTKLPLGFEEGSFVEGSLQLNASIIRNKALEYDFSAIIDEFTDKNIETDFSKIPDKFKDKITVVDNRDGTYTISFTMYESIDESGRFIGSYNNTPCTVVYTEEERTIFTATFTKSELVLFNELCYGGAEEQIKYLVAPLGKISFTNSNYERFYSESGELLYENAILEDVEYVYQQCVFAFMVDKTTKNVVGVYQIDYIETHIYSVGTFNTEDAQCGSTLVFDATCKYCGTAGKMYYTEPHSVKLHAELAEGAESCEEGVLIIGKCSKCDEEIGRFENPVYEHVFADTSTSPCYSELECLICHEREFKLKGYNSETKYYTDDNGTEHRVEVYIEKYCIEMGGMGFCTELHSMADYYTDTEDNECVDYYVNVTYDRETSSYSYVSKFSYTLEKEEPTESCDHNVYEEPETTTEEADGTVTLKSTATATCPVCETVITETAIQTIDADENVIYESFVRTENGITVYENTSSYVYVGEDALPTYQKQFDAIEDYNAVCVMSYDDEGNVLFESFESTSRNMTNYAANTYAYKDGKAALIRDESKMLYNGKLITWIAHTYEGIGCDTDVTTIYYNSDGTEAFRTVEENVHEDVTVRYDLLPTSNKCTDGYLVTVYCNVCKKTVETRVEKSEHIIQDYTFEGECFTLMAYYCLCGEQYDYNVNGSYNVNKFELYDKETGSYGTGVVYLFESGEILLNIMSSSYDGDSCIVEGLSSWYYAKSAEFEFDKFFVFDDYDSVIGVKLENMTFLFEAKTDSYESHSETYKETTNETTEGTNKIVTVTRVYTCRTCGKYFYTETKKTVTNNGKFVSCVAICEYATGRYEKRTFNESGNVTFIESDSGDGSYATTEYKHYACGFVQISRYYYKGELVHTNFNVNENHSFYNEDYYFVYATPGSTSCEDGIYRVYVCSDCGIEWTDEYYVYTSHETVKNVLWTYEHSCGSEEKAYILKCLCGENESDTVDFTCMTNSLMPEEINGKMCEVYSLQCTCCGEVFAYYVKEYSRIAIDATGCTTKEIRVYYCGASRDSLTEIYRTEEVVVNHPMGAVEPSTVNGTLDNGNNYTKTTNRISCTECDHYTETIRYTEYDANGNLVCETLTRAADGIVFAFTKNQYIYDSFGNRYSSYLERKNASSWTIVERKYDFENCSMEQTLIAYDKDGKVIRTQNKTDTCHVDGETVYEIVYGSSCNEGVSICEKRICARCDNTYSTKEHWTYSHEEFQNVVSKEIIETECGKLEVTCTRCPCGARENIELNYACSFNRMDEYSNENNDVYRCAITDCGYIYSRETVYEMADDCMRYTYYVYRFGVSEEDLFGDDCDYKITVLNDYSRWHDTECTGGNEEDYRYSKYVCKNCGNIVSEYHYNLDGNQIYYYQLNDDGSSYSFTTEYDEYERVTLSHYQNSEGYWSKNYYEYNNDSPCEYIRYEWYEDPYCEKEYRGEESISNHNHNLTYWLTTSCTQHNTMLNVCSRCGDQYFDYAGSPTCHNYEAIFEDDNIVGYYCTYCGLENEIGVNGYFILEDLSNNYDGFAAGFYFPEQSEISDWILNFYVTVTNENGETREVSINNIEYTFLEVYSSGTVIIDMNSYYEAVEEILEAGERVSEFTFSFDAYDESKQEYYAHRLTITVE